MGAGWTYVASSGERLAKLLPLEEQANSNFGGAIDIDNGLVYATEIGSISDPNEALVRVLNAATGAQVGQFVGKDSLKQDFYGQQYYNTIAVDGSTAVLGLGDTVRGYNTTTGEVRFESSVPTNRSVAIEDDVVLVGSPVSHSVNAPLFGSDSGRVTLLNALTGDEIGQLLPSLDQHAPGFGREIDIDEGIAIVSSGYEDFTNPNRPWSGGSGAAYLFDVSTGEQLARLTPESAVGERFGERVAIGGGIAAVTSYAPEVWIGGSISRQSSIFLFDVVTGEQIGQIRSDYLGHGEHINDDFGSAIAIEEDLLVVGARFYDGLGDGETSGTAFVYRMVPEPASAVLSLLGGMIVMARRVCRA